MDCKSFFYCASHDSKLKNSTREQCEEIIAALYTVWNNRIINHPEISDSWLKKDFLDWDPNKSKYKDRIDKAINRMRQQNIVPVGWGKIIAKESVD